MIKLNVKDRIVQFANRYLLRKADTQEELGTFDFDEATGTVTEEGTVINKELFDKIDANFDELDTGLKNEITDRTAAVTAEQTRATTAEGELGKKIAAETTRATGVEDSLRADLTAEEKAREKAVSDEAARATAAEKKNADAIAAETSAREAAITKEVTDRDAAIKVETDRAKTTEAQLESKKVNLSGGELKDTVVTFPDYTTNDNNIASGETAATLFGKIKKWFGRLRALAFKATVGTADIDDKAVTKSKLESSLQDSIDKADSALQSVPDISISPSGSGNAVTNVTASGHKLTVTKELTFAVKDDVDTKNSTQDSAIEAAQAKADAAMPKSGGTFTGRVNFNAASLPQNVDGILCDC